MLQKVGMVPITRVDEVRITYDGPILIINAKVILIETLPNRAQIITLLHCVVDGAFCLGQ